MPHCFVIMLKNCFDYDLNKDFLIPPGFPVNAITTSITCLWLYTFSGGAFSRISCPIGLGLDIFFSIKGVLSKGYLGELCVGDTPVYVTPRWAWGMTPNQNEWAVVLHKKRRKAADCWKTLTLASTETQDTHAHTRPVCAAFLLVSLNMELCCLCSSFEA